MTADNTILVLANYYQFSNHQRIHQSCVNSRMLLWCKAGLGRITVNRETFEVTPGTVFWLPWGRSLTYQADGKRPFFVGGAHIIPDYALRVPVKFQVAHQRKDPLFSVPWRKDANMAGLEGVLHGSFTAETALVRFGEYAVQSFRQSIPGEEEARLMGKLLIREASIFFASEEKESIAGQHSPELTRLLQFIENHLNEPMSLSRLVRFSGRSAPTICRLFKQHRGISPVNTIINMKMEKARQLLLSGNLTAAEIGQAVGIDDPYYFSKLFKKRVGHGPRDYRKAVSLV